MRAITSRDRVPLVDFAEHDTDRDFVRDAQGHLTDKGWVQYDKVFDAFFHGAPVPGARIPRGPAVASSPN